MGKTVVVALANRGAAAPKFGPGDLALVCSDADAGTGPCSLSGALLVGVEAVQRSRGAVRVSRQIGLTQGAVVE